MKNRTNFYNSIGLTRISNKARQIEITDIRGPSKVHVFRLYSDGHVTYNQRCNGHIFYKSFQRVNSGFGYSEYLKAARHLIKSA